MHLPEQQPVDRNQRQELRWLLVLQLWRLKNCKLEVLRMLPGVERERELGLLLVDQRTKELKQLELAGRMRNSQK